MSKVMTKIRLDENIAKVIGRVLESHISGFPAVNALHRSLAAILRASCGEETLADAEIRKTISARLDAKGGIPDGLIDVRVHDGAVVLRGVIPEQHHRQMLCEIADSVAGVRTVHDHLIWIDRYSGVFMVSPEDSMAA
jgi:hypothetical protein